MTSADSTWKVPRPMMGILWPDDSSTLSGSLITSGLAADADACAEGCSNSSSSVSCCPLTLWGHDACDSTGCPVAVLLALLIGWQRARQHALPALHLQHAQVQLHWDPSTWLMLSVSGCDASHWLSAQPVVGPSADLGPLHMWIIR